MQLMMMASRHGNTSQIAKFMGPTWGPPGSCRPQMGSMLAPMNLALRVSALLAICESKRPMNIGIPSQRPTSNAYSFDVPFIVILNKLLNKPSISIVYFSVSQWLWVCLYIFVLCLSLAVQVFVPSNLIVSCTFSTCHNQVYVFAHSL